MEPNLKSRNAHTLEFSTLVPLSLDQISKIRGIANPDKDGDSVFFGSYKGHRYLAVVKNAKINAQEHEIEFTYEARSASRLPKSFAKVSELIEILSLVKKQLQFNCSVSFAFGRSLHPKSIINLPMMYTESTNMPFDRIQGLHLVKLEGNEIKYDLYFDAPSQGLLFESVEFNYLLTFDEPLAEKVLAKAEAISNRVVFTSSKGAKNAK